MRASNRALLPGPPARNTIGSSGGVWETTAGTRTTASRIERPLSFCRFSGTISTPQLALSKPGTGAGVCGHGPGSNLADAARLLDVSVADFLPRSTDAQLAKSEAPRITSAI